MVTYKLLSIGGKKLHRINSEGGTRFLGSSISDEPYYILVTTANPDTQPEDIYGTTASGKVMFSIEQVDSYTWKYTWPLANNELITLSDIFNTRNSSGGSTKQITDVVSINMSNIRSDNVVVSTPYLLADCRNLESVNMFNTKRVTDMTYSFFWCNRLRTIPPIDTRNVTTMHGMFWCCYDLETVPVLDTANVTDMGGMFMLCYKNLREVPMMDTSNVTDMSSMFYSCEALQSVPEFNTLKVESMKSMFRECLSLAEVPQFNTSNVKDMDYMFYGCSSLTTVPLLDTSNVTTMYRAFENCTSLEQLPELDISNVTILDAFRGCTNLRRIPFKNIKVSMYLKDTAIDKEGIIEVFNNLVPTSEPEFDRVTIKRALYNSLSEDELAIATDKGWTVTGV